ncbi:MAG TPA: mechanosensitive ion channel family protein, partial [Hanamia sp.]
IRLWVATSQQGEYLQVKNDAVMRIKKAYDENGILIPFPVTTLDFGIKRGVSLGEIPLEVNNNQTDDKITSPKENEGRAMMNQENKNQR